MQIIEKQKPQTFRDLVSLAREKVPVTEQKILKAIQKLQNDGKITFSEQPLRTSSQAGFGIYLEKSQALWFWLTLTITIATATVTFTVSEDSYPWIYLRNVLGVIFVLWLPGYTFIKALFPQEAPVTTVQKGLDTIERVALSLGMSLALVPVTGFLLNYTPWGIRLTSITLSLLTLTLICTIVGVTREHRIHMARTRQQAKTA